MRSVLLHLLLVMLAACPATGSGAAGRAEAAAGDPPAAHRADPGSDAVPGVPAPGDTTFLYMDFEDGDDGGWRRFMVRPHMDSLSLRVVAPPPGNRSAGCLRAAMPFESENGFVVYRLEARGLDPVPVTPRTRVSWCWRTLDNEGTNGTWLILGVRDRRDGTPYRVRYVTRLKWTHDVARLYQEDYNVWRRHGETPYEWLSRRARPWARGDLLIEWIGVQMVDAANAAVWLDDLWLGEGQAPPGAALDAVQEDAVLAPSRLQGAGWGFLDDDRVPDRVEVYVDRVDVLLDPARREIARGERAARSGRVEPDLSVPLEPQRMGGAVSIVDLTGDGRNDILVLFSDGSGTLLLENELPRGRLVDRTGEAGDLRFAGEFFYDAAAGDLDGDGDLDLVLANPYPRRYLFGGLRVAENRDGCFFDVTEGSGVVSDISFGVTAGDVDGDGDRDLVVPCRGREKETAGGVPSLYLGDGAGRFLAEPDLIDLPGGLFPEGCVLADLDNDGDPDLYVTVREERFADYPPNRPGLDRLLENDGGRFVDVTEAAGLGDPAAPPAGSRQDRASQAALAGDFDQDGLVDLFLVNDGGAPCVMLWNRSGPGGLRFEADSTGGPFSFAGEAKGGAAVDIDADGDLDVALWEQREEGGVHLLLNRTARGNRLQVRPRGVRGRNTEAIGATVAVYEAGKAGEASRLVAFREIAAGGGYGSAAPPAAHVGLGGRERVDVVVRFPAVGEEEPAVAVMRSVEANRYLEVLEPAPLRLSLLRGPALRRLGDRAIGLLFALPAIPFFALAALCMGALGAGLIGRRRPSPGRLAALGACLLVAAAAVLFRSAGRGAVSIAAAAVCAPFLARLAWLRRRGVTDTERRALGELLLDQLGAAIHTEDTFAFLRSFLADGGIYGEEETNGFARLERLIEDMRTIAPDDPAVGEAGTALAEVGAAARHVGDLRATEADPGRIAGEAAVYRSALARLTRRLDAFRSRLRARYAVDLRAALEAFAAGAAPVLEKSGARLDLALPETGELLVHLTDEEFYHLFGNLLSNSVRAMASSAERLVRCAVGAEGRAVRVVWTDTGPGVPDGLRDRLLRAPVISTGGGAGEGLYRAARIIERRRGLIRCEAPGAGGGARFVMKFVRIMEG